MTRLCDSLAASMIADDQPIVLRVEAAGGAVTSEHAVSMGLIVTELVINALKHAFPKNHENAEVLISYETSDTTWRLVVSDNGVGKPAESDPPRRGGLGTSLVTALAQQLDARIETSSNAPGLKISIVGATVGSQLVPAA